MASGSKDLRKGQGFRLASGFLFTVFFCVFLFSYHIYSLSSFKTVERVGLTLMREMVDTQLIAELFYPEMVRLAEHSPDSNLIVPGMGIELDVKAAEIKGVPKDQLGEFIARSVIRQIYYKGFSNTYRPDGLNETQQTGLEGLYNLTDIFVNKRFNDKMLLLFYISTFLTVLLALPFFLLSAGFQKFTGFGGSFIAAGAPGLPLMIVRERTESMMLENEIASSLIGETILPLINIAQRNFLIVLLLGMGLFLIGVSGNFFTKRRAKLAKKLSG